VDERAHSGHSTMRSARSSLRLRSIIHLGSFATASVARTPQWTMRAVVAKQCCDTDKGETIDDFAQGKSRRRSISRAIRFNTPYVLK
jgi:hypothetical protein